MLLFIFLSISAFLSSITEKFSSPEVLLALGGECCEMLITQSSQGIREMELCDDMILWCSLQLPLLADWKNLARRLGVQSVIPIVRDVIESSEKVSTSASKSSIRSKSESSLSRRRPLLGPSPG